MNYSEKLKDPRWQKKRLEILQHDGFTCQHCHDEKETLHIHHYEYKKGTEPWDYDDINYVTLCETCHLIIEDSKWNCIVYNIKIRPNDNRLQYVFSGSQGGEIILYMIYDKTDVWPKRITSKLEFGLSSIVALQKLIEWINPIEQEKYFH